MNPEPPSSNLKIPDLQNVSDTANNVKDTLTKSVGDLGQKFSDVRGTLTKTLDDFSSTSAADAGKEFLEANTIVAKFSFVIIVLIGFLFLMRLGMIIISYIFSPSQSPYLIKGVISGSNSKEVVQDPRSKNTTVFLSENERTGLELTYSVWLYLDGVATDTELKHIFSKGAIDTTTGFGTIDAVTKLPGATSTLNKTYNAPGLYTFRNGEGGNNIRVYMDSFITPMTTSDLSGQVQMVDVSGVPINKWFNTTIRVENRVLDVYVNGVLTKRKDLETIPRQNFYSVFVCQNGGFSGYLSDLRYFNKSLNVFEINSIVNSGPNLKSSSDSDYNNVPDNLQYLSNNWYLSNT
jgi:hypothetical protein